MFYRFKEKMVRISGSVVVILVTYYLADDTD